MQQKMAGYEEPDIDLSWDEIDKALEANRLKASETERPKAKVIPLWQRRVAAAAVGLLLVGVGFWTLQRQPPEAVVQNRGVWSEERGVRNEECGVRAPASAQSVRAMPPRVISLHTPHSTLLGNPPSEAADEESLPTNEADERSTEEATGESEEATQTQEESRAPSLRPTSPTVIYPSDIRKQASSGNRLTAKVYISNTTTGYSSMLSSTQRILIPKGSDSPTDKPTLGTNVDTPGGAEEGSDATNYDPPSDGNTDSNNEEEGNTDQQTGKTRQGETGQYHTQHTDETTHHHQPVRIGLSLRYKLNERWSVESGLTYTRLSSDFTKTVDGQSSTTEQHLTYIGIPVSVSYLLWGSRYLNAYVSAGGMVEKMVKGSQQTFNTTTSVTLRPLQFSLSSAIGAEFNINRQFSLYVEPGIGYWFDNGSSLPTYYQDKPFSFSLNLGFRVKPW